MKYTITCDAPPLDRSFTHYQEAIIAAASFAAQNEGAPVTLTTFGPSPFQQNAPTILDAVFGRAVATAQDGVVNWKYVDLTQVEPGQLSSSGGYMPKKAPEPTLYPISPPPISYLRNPPNSQLRLPDVSHLAHLLGPQPTPPPTKDFPPVPPLSEVMVQTTKIEPRDPPADLSGVPPLSAVVIPPPKPISPVIAGPPPTKTAPPSASIAPVQVDRAAIEQTQKK